MRRPNWIPMAAAAALLSACGGHHPAPTVPAGRTITMNSEVTGRLSQSDPHFAGDRTAYQTWTFTGAAGEMVQIDLASAQFDPFLILQDATGTELAHDDDSGGGTNARIRFALPATGTYRILAKAYRELDLGAYSLRLERLGTMAPGGNGATIQRGQLMTGRLQAGDPQMSDKSVYHVYNYAGRAGEAITIDVMSSDFDAFAILQDPQGNEITRDDDSGQGTDARITTVLRQSGIYRIVVNTYDARGLGSYTIWVH